MDVEITPEPSAAEREAILAALAADEESERPPPWRQAGLGAEQEDQAVAPPRQSRGAARA
jgi:hypothetical protein